MPIPLAALPEPARGRRMVVPHATFSSLGTVLHGVSVASARLNADAPPDADALVSSAATQLSATADSTLDGVSSLAQAASEQSSVLAEGAASAITRASTQVTAELLPQLGSAASSATAAA